VLYGTFSRSGERDKQADVRRKFYFMDLPDVKEEELNLVK
jgi:hypothetical protein